MFANIKSVVLSCVDSITTDIYIYMKYKFTKNKGNFKV